MFSIFSIPKPFEGHIGVIQRNALKSWTLLNPRCQVILFGDDSGVAEAAAENGALHVPEVPVNERGVPQLGWAFRMAAEVATEKTLCYVNADILLVDDIIDAARRIGFPEFLLVGQRWDINVGGPMDFTGDWQSRLVLRAHEDGSPHPPAGSDYFVFPTSLNLELPPFAVGRAGWDNWMLYNARARRIPLVDGTGAATVVHQAHDYSHHSEVRDGDWAGEETDANRQLGGDPRRSLFVLADATWRLGPVGPPARSWQYLKRVVSTGPVLHPLLQPLGLLPRIASRLRKLVSSARGTATRK